MRRKLFNLAAAVSLVLCLATVILWYMTWDRPEQANAEYYTDGWLWDSGRGNCRVGRLTITNEDATEWEITYEYRYDRQMLLPGLDVVRDGTNLRLREPRDSMPKGALVAFRSEWKVVASHSTLVLLLAALPVAYCGAAAWLAFRRRQRRSGLCPACGYDLRATLERCPECGRVSSDTPAAAA